MGAQKWTMATRNFGISSTIKKSFSVSISITLEFYGSELEFLAYYERAMKSYKFGEDRNNGSDPLYLTFKYGLTQSWG